MFRCDKFFMLFTVPYFIVYLLYFIIFRKINKFFSIRNTFSADNELCYIYYYAYFDVSRFNDLKWGLCVLLYLCVWIDDALYILKSLIIFAEATSLSLYHCCCCYSALPTRFLYIDVISVDTVWYYPKKYHTSHTHNIYIYIYNT